ncbi:GTP cyclohydrolase II [Paenarthrobacter sp. PH39-S1]|uniref:GTP cyclohydrolase II n=1 Tax=Paenarthrobacter sp. PH39-S1 TaxID=3046204 RepID=UPI0024B9546B|nr:GTP cyclohydrolase II [Paenarthrobacter sp. PH39-S1]
MMPGAGTGIGPESGTGAVPESGTGAVPEPGTGTRPVSAGPLVQLPTVFGEFLAQAWIDGTTGAEHLTVSAAAPGATQQAARTPQPDGTPQSAVRAGAAPLVRLHSECLTGDVFGSYRCDCGEQLAYALQMIHAGGGTLIYLRGHEGRGIGLANKLRAYALQEAGADTVEANEQLGLPVDSRDYAAAAAILAELGLHRIRLMSNNPLKQSQLAALGIEVTEMVPTEVPSREQNVRYLETKRDRMNHILILPDHAGAASTGTAAKTPTITAASTAGPTSAKTPTTTPATKGKRQ